MYSWRPYKVLYIVLFLPVRHAALVRSRRRAAQLFAVTAVAFATLTAFANPAGASPGPSGGSFDFLAVPPPGVAAPSEPVSDSLNAPGSAGGPPRQLYVPDLIATTPHGINPEQLASITKLAG